MNNQENEIKTRDKEAEKFEEWYLRKGHFYNSVEKEVILRALSPKSNDVILDAGCGTGRLTRDIAKRCKKVYALDFSPKSIEVLNEKAASEGIKNIETLICDLTKSIPLEEKVDKIVSVQVIQHIPNEGERFEALRKFHGQLKLGGTCAVTFYNQVISSRRALLKEGEFPGGIYYYRFTPKEAYNLFKRCGFRDISIRGCVNFKDYAYLEGRKIDILLCLIAKLDAFLSNFSLSSLFGDFLLCKGIK